MTPTQRILRQWESPPTWLLLFSAIVWLQSKALLVWDVGALGDWLGTVFIAAGVGLLVAALLQFRRARTTVMPREVARVLMTDGVYGLSRNPIYVADALVLTGLCFWWDLGALIWVGVFVAVIDRRFVAGEEAGLRTKFRAEFERWAAKTRRWL